MEKVILNLRQSAIRNPQKGYAQQLHNDTRISNISNPLIIQAIWMIDDFTKDNGGTKIVPYIINPHLFKRTKKYKNEKIIEAKKDQCCY